MLDGFERIAQPATAIRGKPLDCDRVRRRYSVIAVVDLLRKYQFDKGLLCISEGIEISFRTNP